MTRWTDGIPWKCRHQELTVHWPSLRISRRTGVSGYALEPIARATAGRILKAAWSACGRKGSNWRMRRAANEGPLRLTRYKVRTTSINSIKLGYRDSTKGRSIAAAMAAQAHVHPDYDYNGWGQPEAIWLSI